MGKRLLSVGIISFLFFTKSLAYGCTCSWEGPFLRSAPSKTLIAAVKIIRYTSAVTLEGKKIPASMEVEILNILKGSEERKTLTIWGNNGGLCRPYLGMFPPGSSFVLGLEPSGKDNGHSMEKPEDYFIPGCGINWLALGENHVFGQITSHSYQSAMWLDYLSFKINLLNREPENRIDSIAFDIIRKNFTRNDIKVKAILERRCRDRSALNYNWVAKPKDENTIYPYRDLIENCASAKSYFIFWEEKGFLQMSIVNDCMYSRKPVKLGFESSFFQFYESYKGQLLGDKKIYEHPPEGKACADVIHLYDGNSVYINLLWDFQPKDQLMKKDIVEQWALTLYLDIANFYLKLSEEDYLKKLFKSKRLLLTSGE